MIQAFIIGILSKAGVIFPSITVLEPLTEETVNMAGFVFLYELLPSFLIAIVITGLINLFALKSTPESSSPAE